jgi:hypothetical protein
MEMGSQGWEWSAILRRADVGAFGKTSPKSVNHKQTNKPVLHEK